MFGAAAAVVRRRSDDRIGDNGRCNGLSLGVGGCGRGGGAGVSPIAAVILVVR